MVYEVQHLCRTDPFCGSWSKRMAVVVVQRRLRGSATLHQTCLVLVTSSAGLIIVTNSLNKYKRGAASGNKGMLPNAHLQGKGAKKRILLSVRQKMGNAYETLLVVCGGGADWRYPHHPNSLIRNKWHENSATCLEKWGTYIWSAKHGTN